jgi:DNA invertase Pin-like site-specific DNA recombinase
MSSSLSPIFANVGTFGVSSSYDSSMLHDELQKRRRRKRPSVSNDAEVLAYLRVSTDEQADSGAGLDAQRTAIQAEALRRGWVDRLRWIEDAGVSAATLDRPGIREALARLDNGRASVLVAAKIDRLSRSILDFATLTDRAERDGWSLVALDAGLDMTTAAGKMMAGVLSVFAAYERDLIAERTRKALASRKAQGRPVSGPGLSPELRGRLRTLRSQRMTFQAIADKLNDEGVPTARHARWFPSTVSNALKVE